MQLLLTLSSFSKEACIPINYQYPLSSAIYRIIAKGNAEYANFLHETGYGKGFKLFTFSQLNVPFKVTGDRLRLLGSEVSFLVAFHLPQALENFVKGLFQSEQIDIADKRSRAGFTVKSVESLSNPLQQYRENEIINIHLNPLSPVVAGLHNEKGNYDFLSPEDSRFTECLVYNWRSKIAACYDEETAASALLMVQLFLSKKPFKSRLITIKAGTPEETKIRGWMNFGLKVTGERRFVELLMNSGCGIYNSVIGGGCLEVVIKSQ
jgi:CRISPR-associated endoribonuclease Cas6